MDKNQATQDTNVSRRRHYGIRIGDIVQSAFGEEPPHFKGAAEVIEYGGFDNNRVKLRYEDGKEGDYVAITDAGAYGMSLASNYNLRPIIAEIMVTGSKHKLIKKRQSLENLINN